MADTLQVAFYKGRTRFFNRLVSWWLNGPYSHAELILDTDAGGYAACASSSFLDGGVRLKYMRLDPEHWDIVGVQGDKATAWAWLKEHDGDRRSRRKSDRPSVQRRRLLPSLKWLCGIPTSLHINNQNKDG